MAGAQQHLARWREAGLIDEELRQRILSYEASQAAGRETARGEKPGLVEALLYLGVAVAVAGVCALTGEHWHALGGGARIATLGVPGVCTLLAGLFLYRRTEPQLARAGGVAWLACLFLFGGAMAVAGTEGGWGVLTTPLAAAAVVAALAAALWTLNQSRPQLIGLAGGLVFLGESIAVQWQPYHAELGGVLVLLCGVVGIVLAERGYLRPRAVAADLSALLVAGGALQIEAGIGAHWTGLPLLAAGIALSVLSLRRGGLTYLVIGVITIFCGLTAFIFHNFEHTIGVPAALLVTGCLLVVGVVIVSIGLRRLRERGTGTGDGLHRTAPSA